MIYWQLHNSQQCWEQLEQSFGGENNILNSVLGQTESQQKEKVLQKNGGDAARAVELFLAAASLFHSNSIPKAALAGVAGETISKHKVTYLQGCDKCSPCPHIQWGP